MIKATDIISGIESVLNRTTQESIMEHYLGVEVSKARFCNPLRNDKSPGCSFFYSHEGMLFFKD